MTRYAYILVQSKTIDDIRHIELGVKSVSLLGDSCSHHKQESFEHYAYAVLIIF